MELVRQEQQELQVVEEQGKEKVHLQLSAQQQEVVILVVQVEVVTVVPLVHKVAQV